MWRATLCALAAVFAVTVAPASTYAASAAPVPLLSRTQPVTWWFVFKFNAETFPTRLNDPDRLCPFGGQPKMGGSIGQRYAVASSRLHALKMGAGLLGTSNNDPLGATFGQVYEGGFNYVLWNDQFYEDPDITGCRESCPSPWAHSKGMLAWNDAGEGFVLQVTTPSWPGSGSSAFPRPDGNTLGCVSNDNNIKYSKHFFALKLSKKDVAAVLDALYNAGVVTNTIAATPAGRAQVTRSSGRPLDLDKRVRKLGKKPPISGSSVTKVVLSSGVILLAKPSTMHAPPWQLVSAELNGVPLRTATWWSDDPIIYSTKPDTPMNCLPASVGRPGTVENAMTGKWGTTAIGLSAGTGIREPGHPASDYNHAKIGVSLDKARPYTIFGDLNQQGALSGVDYDACGASQNGRGGLFFVVKDAALWKSVSELIKGRTAAFAPGPS